VIVYGGKQFRWQRDLVANVKAACGNQLTLSTAEIDRRPIQMLQPGVLMLVCVPEKESLHFHAFAFLQESLQ
jgi:hypothetical protein